MRVRNLNLNIQLESQVYHKLHGIISTEPVKDYVPYSWISLSQVKSEHYKALAHFYVAVGLLEHDANHFSTRAEELLQVSDAGCMY